MEIDFLRGEEQLLPHTKPQFLPSFSPVYSPLPVGRPPHRIAPNQDYI